MSTFVSVNTYTHSVTYVTGNILRCLQDIVRESGLNPKKIADQWDTLERGIGKWIETQYLETITLEVYNPVTDKLIGAWEFPIFYGYTDGSGSFYVDTDLINWAIKKAGVWPSNADYRIITHTKSGRPAVVGWSNATLRSTEGFVKQSLGTMIEGAGLSTGAAFWRPA